MALNPTGEPDRQETLRRSRRGIIKERIGRLNAIELPIQMLFRDDKLIPPEIKDIFPKKGTLTFPFLASNANQRDTSTGTRFAVRMHHERSAYLGTCRVVDEFGTPYVYMDVKGIGNSTIRNARFVSEPWERTGVRTDPEGLLSLSLARNDKKYSNIFAKAGIAGHRVVVLFEYLKLPVPVKGGGEKLVSTHNLLRRIERANPKALPDRAVGVARVFTDIRLNALRRRDLPSLYVRLNRRFSTNIKSPEEYVVWMCRRLAENLAIMHKLGCTHRYLSDHNVLADGSFIDHDSVTGPEDYGRTREQMSDVSVLLDDTATPPTFGERKKRDLESLESGLRYIISTLLPGIDRNVVHAYAKTLFTAAYRVEMVNPRLSRFEK